GRTVRLRGLGRCRLGRCGLELVGLERFGLGRRWLGRSGGGCVGPGADPGARRHEVCEPLVAVGADESDASSAPPPVEGHDDLVVAPLLQLVHPRVPDLYMPSSVLALGDLALERAVLERMVLGVHGEVVALGVRRLALRQGPAHEDAVALEPEVEVLAPRVVLLDDKAPPAGAWDGS